MPNNDDTLIDKDGVVYEKGWFGQYYPKIGWLGPERDTTWTGQPNVKRNWLGLPEEARDWLGMPVRSIDGKVLYRRAKSEVDSWGGGDAAEAALAFLLSIGLFILFLYIVSAVLALVVHILVALFNGWRSLTKRYPRTMLIVHLLLGMGGVGGALRFAGFRLEGQIVGAALVPLLWGWVWITRRLPLIFIPINSALVGSALWFAARLTTPFWLPTWLHWTAGLPLMSNLPLLLALFPTFSVLWILGARRWPQVFQPLNRLALGAVFSFVLLRVWTDWQPLWIMWVKPVPLLPQATAWLIFLLPLGIWLWRKAQERWPLLFTALNLLLFGGLLGLTAYHTQPAWLDIWYRWAGGLPFATAPILTISLSPVALWGWSWASRRWAKVFVVPNLLLWGGILWLILDRTRPLWGDAWRTVWGEVPLSVDPARLMLVLPLGLWVWGYGSRRWPHYWGALRAMLWGGILWWIAERTHSRWYEAWYTFVGPKGLDLALVALLAPLSVWVWWQLYRYWPREVKIVTGAGIPLLLGWMVGRLLPESRLVLRITIAFLPVTTWGWFWLWHHRPRLAWLLTLLPIAGVGLFAWLAPDHFQALLRTFMGWLAEQGIVIGTW